MFKKTDILFYKEVCSLAFVIAIGLSLIVVTVKLTSFTELIFASPNILSTISLIFFYLLPPILTTVLPISIFTAAALTTIRMNVDREIEALFASGMSIVQLLQPTILIGVSALLLMLANTFYYEPYSQNQFRFFKWFQAQQIVESFFINNIKEKTFLSNIPFFEQDSFVFYNNAINSDREMTDVFIALKSDDFFTNDVLMAQSGRFFKATYNGYPDFQFELNNATIYSNDTNTTKFKKINISMLNAFGAKLKTNEKFTSVPFEFSANNMSKPISMAFCVLFFPALGVCLGSHRAYKQVWRVYLGIALVIGMFYSSFAVANVIIKHTDLPRLFVFSLPPILFAIITIAMAIERRKLK